jgi:hypothetical protein
MCTSAPAAIVTGARRPNTKTRLEVSDKRHVPLQPEPSFASLFVGSSNKVCVFTWSDLIGRIEDARLTAEGDAAQGEKK